MEQQNCFAKRNNSFKIIMVLAVCFCMMMFIPQAYAAGCKYTDSTSCTYSCCKTGGTCSSTGGAAYRTCNTATGTWGTINYADSLCSKSCSSSSTTKKVTGEVCSSGTECSSGYCAPYVSGMGIGTRICCSVTDQCGYQVTGRGTCYNTGYSITLSSGTWTCNKGIWSKSSSSSGVCKDTDGGTSTTARGTCTSGGSSYTDTCTSTSSLKEYGCSSGQCMVWTMSCPSGYTCSNGACVSSGSSSGADYKWACSNSKPCKSPYVCAAKSEAVTSAYGQSNQVCCNSGQCGVVDVNGQGACHAVNTKITRNGQTFTCGSGGVWQAGSTGSTTCQSVCTKQGFSYSACATSAQITTTYAKYTAYRYGSADSSCASGTGCYCLVLKSDDSSSGADYKWACSSTTPCKSPYVCASYSQAVTDAYGYKNSVCCSSGQCGVVDVNGQGACHAVNTKITRNGQTFTCGSGGVWQSGNADSSGCVALITTSKENYCEGDEFDMGIQSSCNGVPMDIVANSLSVQVFRLDTGSMAPVSSTCFLPLGVGNIRFVSTSCSTGGKYGPPAVRTITVTGTTTSGVDVTATKQLTVLEAGSSECTGSGGSEDCPFTDCSNANSGSAGWSCLCGTNAVATENAPFCCASANGGIGQAYAAGQCPATCTGGTSGNCGTNCVSNPNCQCTANMRTSAAAPFCCSTTGLVYTSQEQCTTACTSGGGNQNCVTCTGSVSVNNNGNVYTVTCNGVVAGTLTCNQGTSTSSANGVSQICCSGDSGNNPNPGTLSLTCPSTCARGGSCSCTISGCAGGLAIASGAPVSDFFQMNDITANPMAFTVPLSNGMVGTVNVVAACWEGAMGRDTKAITVS